MNKEFSVRIKKFQRELRKKKIDVALLVNLKDICSGVFYFSCVDVEGVYLIIPKKGKAILYSVPMQYEMVKKQSGVKVVKLKRGFLKSGKLKGRIGVNKEVLSVKVFDKLKKDIRKNVKSVSFADVSGIFGDLRKIKTKKEIFYVKKACKIVDKIFMKLKRRFSKFKTEIDVVEFIEKEVKRENVELAFPIIVASGKNASMPHYFPKKVKLNKGFCVIDFGVKYKGYCCDMSRTVYIGKPSNKEVDAYEEVLEVQEECITKLKIGVKFKSVDKFSREKWKYPHALGHGVGIEIHEKPGFGGLDKVEKGMVFAVEPAIYKSGKYGIRIEDTCVVEKGCKAITMASKKLFCV
jgi:Xaa-Pro aminopeptidase